MLSSVTLRVLAMGTRFILLLVLVKLAPVRVVADYGVLVGFVTSMSYFLSFDFYIQASRNVRRPRIFQTYLSNQVCVSALAFAGLSLALTVALPDALARTPLLVLLALLLTGLLLQEFSRLLLAYGRYQITNLLQFLRLGMWPLIALFDILLRGVQVDALRDLVGYWLTVNIMATAVGIWTVSRVLAPFRFTPSLRLFRAALPRQTMIFASSVVLLLFSGLDRVLLATSAPDAYVAGYVFFGSLYGITLTLIYSGLINPYYASFADKTIVWSTKVVHLRRFGVSAIAFTVFMLVALYFGTGILLDLLDRAEYLHFAHLRHFFATYVMLSVIALIPHFGLFARRRDGMLASVSVLTGIVFLLTWVWLEGRGVADAMPVTLCVGAASLALGKAVGYHHTHAST